MEDLTSNEKHLEGLTADEIKIIRNLATVYVKCILKMADEKSLSINTDAKPTTKHS